MSSPSITVVIVNYAAGGHLAACLDALERQSFRDFEAIVINNGTPDPHFDRARRARGDSRFRFVAFDKNLGFAAANNRAAAEARGRWLALLNPDAFPHADWLERMVEAAERNPGIDMFGSTQIDAGDPACLDGVGNCYHAFGVAWRGGHGWKARFPVADREVFGPCAAAALFRTDRFIAMGGFDERFFCFVEDVDLAFRWQLAGGRCLQIGAALVDHVGAGCTDRIDGFACYHGLRNSIWCFVKNMPGPLLWPLLAPHAVLMAALGIRWILRGQAGAVGRAYRDALVGLPAIWRSRVDLQSRHPAALRALIRRLAWNPLHLWTRRPVGHLAPAPEEGYSLPTLEKRGR